MPAHLAEPRSIPRASIVIANYNGLALLRPCLDALRRQAYGDYEIIVADNASSDGSTQVLATDYPEVRVLPLAANGGYSAGCNAGIRAARGEYLVMLNNDTEAGPGWLGALVAALDRHPEAGSAASRLMLFDDRTKLNSAGDLFRRSGMPDSRGVWQEYGPPYDQECTVFGACGGAVAYRRSMLANVGLFEERFFMYCEDVDLNWRAQLAGWKCIYAPEALVYHRLSASGGGTLSSFLVGRNTLWVIARNYPSTLLKRYWRQIISAQWEVARSAFRTWRGSASRARLRGQLIGLLTCWRWLGERRAIQARRRVSDAYLESILS